MSRPTSPLHVLVADDYPDVAQLVVEMLTELSPMPLTADVGYNGADALRLAIAHPPQLAVLDIDMPVLNGVDAAIAIRAALGQARPVLVAMTGRAPHGARAADGDAFDRVLLKPLDMEVLQSIMNAVCDRDAEPGEMLSGQTPQP